MSGSERLTNELGEIDWRCNNCSATMREQDDSSSLPWAGLYMPHQETMYSLLAAYPKPIVLNINRVCQVRKLLGFDAIKTVRSGRYVVGYRLGDKYAALSVPPQVEPQDPPLMGLINGVNIIAAAEAANGMLGLIQSLNRHRAIAIGLGLVGWVLALLSLTGVL